MEFYFENNKNFSFYHVLQFFQNRNDYLDFYAILHLFQLNIVIDVCC